MLAGAAPAPVPPKPLRGLPGFAAGGASQAAISQALRSDADAVLACAPTAAAALLLNPDPNPGAPASSEQPAAGAKPLRPSPGPHALASSEQLPLMALPLVPALPLSALSPYELLAAAAPRAVKLLDMGGAYSTRLPKLARPAARAAKAGFRPGLCGGSGEAGADEP